MLTTAGDTRSIIGASEGTSSFLVEKNGSAAFALERVTKIIEPAVKQTANLRRNAFINLNTPSMFKKLNT
jgi:hypothetical protein